MPGDWIKCPRCELNYIKRGEEYCDVCKAELKKGPQLVFAIDDEEELDESFELCPRCNQNYVKPGEKLCEKCLKALEGEEKDVEDAQKTHTVPHFLIHAAMLTTTDSTGLKYMTR